MGDLLQFRQSKEGTLSRDDDLVAFQVKIDGEDLTQFVRSAEIQFSDGGRIQLYPPEGADL